MNPFAACRLESVVHLVKELLFIAAAICSPIRRARFGLEQIFIGPEESGMQFFIIFFGSFCERTVAFIGARCSRSSRLFVCFQFELFVWPRTACIECQWLTVHRARPLTRSRIPFFPFISIIHFLKLSFFPGRLEQLLCDLEDTGVENIVIIVRQTCSRADAYFPSHPDRACMHWS